MKTFDGNVEKRIFVSGKVQKADPDFTADVKPKSKITEARIKKENVFSAIALFALNAVSGVVKVLTALYRFIVSHSIIKQTHNAKASTAPATIIESDNEIKVGNEANLATAPAQDAKIDSKVKTSVYAKLVAYRRAAAVYIKSILTPHEAKLDTAPGTVAAYREEMALTRATKAAAAGSAIMESRENTVATGCKAAGAAAQGETVPGASLAMTATHKAQAGKAAVTGANIKDTLRAVHCASLTWCFLPEQDGNSLHIFQTFSGIQSGNMLEIDMEQTSVYWANAVAKDGALHLAFAETVNQTGNILEVS